ncbi:MAG: hypothetical protein CSA38_03920 [Flavobacteriales bacterium]|nr:MAG: hypothetical protein CSA38_03920 [Flavobacteriales bacterium]
MKKKITTLMALALAISSVSAQQVMCHVDKDALVYVGKDALVYNGGGLQIKDTGKWENHGSVMVDATAADVFKTLDATGADKTDGGNFYNRINDTATGYDYSKVGEMNTYGQLSIHGITQANLTGIVNQEYQRESNGAYQQIGLPFYKKDIIDGLSQDFGVTFTDERWTVKEPLYFDNASAVSESIGYGDDTGVYGCTYFMLGAENSGLDTTVKHTLVGVPFAEEATPDLTLDYSAVGVNFGPGGTNINNYNELYNTYIQDAFHQGNDWEGDFGKNLYQFGNPYLTNLDLSYIHQNANGSNLSNIYGVRLQHTGVTFGDQVGSAAATYRYVTYPTGVPTGDVDRLIVRPMDTFVVKMKDNTGANQALNFTNLRRFKYETRMSSVPYGVAAPRNNANSTVKQLGIIGLDSQGNEVGRTYYVVYAGATTGFSENNVNSAQVKAASANPIGSYEESPEGGYDTNLWNTYWLYINEANENDFLGKNIKVHSYNTNITSLKFEIRENASLVPNGTHQLAQGIGFYYKNTNGQVKQVKQGDIVPLEGYTNNNLAYDFYYGEPLVLGTQDQAGVTSRTRVVYSPTHQNYIVMFDSNWKKAEVKVYDMSGKLVISEKNVDASSDYVIKLNDNLKAAYTVKVVSEKGEEVITKILK